MTSRVKFNEAHFPALGKKPTHSKKDDRKAPINQNQTPRDETPENNDTRFLQWTVLAYKKILRNNCHLLNVSATFRPRTLTKFDSSAHEKDDADHIKSRVCAIRIFFSQSPPLPATVLTAPSIVTRSTALFWYSVTRKLPLTSTVRPVVLLKCAAVPCPSTKQ